MTWSELHPIGFEIALGLASALTLSARGEEGERLFQECIDRARADFDRARIIGVWLPLLTVMGKYAQGVALGSQALEWLKGAFPKDIDEQKALFAQHVQLIESLVSRMEPDDWTPLVYSTDRAHHLKCRLLSHF